MFWLFGIVEKYPKKNCNSNVVHFVPCGLSLTMACNCEQRSRWNWVMQRSLVLRLTLIEKKAALWYNGEKSHLYLLFPRPRNPLFILLPIISSTETILEQFWCELEKIMLYCLWVKVALSSKYDMLTLSPYISLKKFKKIKTPSWPCIKTMIESNFQQIFLSNVC